MAVRAGLARTRVLSGVAEGSKVNVEAVRRVVMAVGLVRDLDGGEDVKLMNRECRLVPQGEKRSSVGGLVG